MRATETAERGYMGTVGNFDGVHLGHSFLLDCLGREAKKRGLKTVVFTFSAHTSGISGAGARLTDNDGRGRLLRGAGIDRLVELDFKEIRGLTAGEFLLKLRREYGVEVLLMGFNNHIGSDRRAGCDLLPTTAGVEIVVCGEYPGQEGLCSSAVRKALLAGDVEQARAILGRAYSLEGTVVHGKRVGRSIGFPTANLETDRERMAPADGVYAVDVSVEGSEKMRGMANIGRRPTVEGHERTIEIHVIGYEGDLYGRRMSVDFLRRLRDERRFGSLEELRCQLERDREAALGV